MADKEKAVPVTITDGDLATHAEGIAYLLHLIKDKPEEYKVIFKHLPPVTQHFLRDFLPDKRKQEQEHNAVDRKDKAGPVVTVWVHNHKNADSITLVEDNLGQKPVKKSLCSIFNDLERSGYRFVTGGGAKRPTESELLFTFVKPTSQPK